MKRGNSLLKFLDKWIGIPFIFVLGTFRKKNRLVLKNIKSIGLLKTAAIGDTVLLSALFEDIKKHNPTIQTYLIYGPSNSSVAPLIPYVDKTIFIENLLNFNKIRKLEKVDVIVNFGQWPRLDALVGYMYPSAFHIGFKTSHQYNHFLFDHSIKHDDKIHELENFRNTLSVLQIKSISFPSLLIPEQPNPIKKQFSADEYIVIHPWISGYKHETKEWPLESWVKLFQKITETYDYKILISGSKEDSERSENLKILANNPNVISVAGKLNLIQVCIVLQEATALVSVNTGIMHMGAAIGTLTVGLSGPTNPKRWGPIGKNAFSVSPNDEGCGYLNLGFEHPKKKIDCMGKITVESVFEALQQGIENYPLATTNNRMSL